jgi:hypothetical protein
MNMAATGVEIMIVTDSIAFPVTVGTGANLRPGRIRKSREIGSDFGE